MSARALDSVFVQLPCPMCHYEIDVEVIDVRLEALVFCPNCKKPIQLVDVGASTHAAGREIDAAMRELRRLFE